MKKQTKDIIQAVLGTDERCDEQTKQKIINLLENKKTDTEQQLLKVKDVAKWLGVSRVTVYTMTKAGQLKTVKLPNGLKRYRLQDLLKMAKMEETHEIA